MDPGTVGLFRSGMAARSTLALMANQDQPTLFTFRPNGEDSGQRLVEITAEPVEQHETPAGAERQSWFGPEEKVSATLEQLAFPKHDIEGVLASLYTNRVATRSVAVASEKLGAVGFSAAQ